VHAYVLMTHHVHLLMTPTGSGQVARLMQALGRRYVNDRYRRTGTLGEARYKSSPIDRDNYRMHGYRYIELNPVRTDICPDPADYPWSSHGSNALGHDDLLNHPYPNYQRLGTTREQRCAAYRAITMETLSDEDIQAICEHLQRQHALGSDCFRSAIEAQLARPVEPLKIGRPRKAPTH
jgi:putative transposase